MKKLLFTLFVMFFLNACERNDISSKYMDYFPYEGGKELSFNTPKGIQKLNIGAAIRHADYGYTKPYELLWSIDGLFIRNDTTFSLAIGLLFSFYEEESRTGLDQKGSDYGNIKVSETGTYVPNPMGGCFIAEDTLLIPNWNVTIIKNRGLVSIKWPQQKNIIDSKKYPNTPWGETWTLIEE